MGKLVIALVHMYILLTVWSFARSSMSSDMQTQPYGDLVFVQRWSTASQLPKSRETPYPYVTSQKGFIDWNLCDKQYTNNLGGLGPDTGAAKELRFYNITTDSDQGIDLVITNTSEYKKRPGSISGLSGCFCTINVKSGGRGTNSVNFDVKTYYTGTYDPVIFSAHYLTIFDVDENKDGKGKESITTYDGVDQVFQYPDHEIEIEGTLDNGLMTFSSTEWGTGVDNPTDPLNMTELQLRRSVTVFYTNTIGWRLSFGVIGGRGGRNFLFAGRSQLANPIYAQPTPPPTPPTPYPTANPTPIPPTPNPTPSPTDISGGHGDPHMVNIRGEHFNIWQLGVVELLRIPRNSFVQAWSEDYHPQI